MLLYDVICENCSYREEDFEKSYSIDFPVKCPSCKKKKLIKDYSSPHALPGFHVKEIKEAGQQAELNKKTMGNELWEKKKDEMLGEHGRKQRETPKPWYWSEGQEKPLDVSKIADTEKFIATGEKD